MSTVSVESDSAVWTGVFTLAFTSGVKTRIRGEIPCLRGTGLLKREKVTAEVAEKYYGHRICHKF